jgi:hypothetical protein
MTLSTMWIGAAAAVHTRPTTVVSKSPALAVIFQVAGGPALRSNTFWQRTSRPQESQTSLELENFDYTVLYYYSSSSDYIYTQQQMWPPRVVRPGAGGPGAALALGGCDAVDSIAPAAL